MDIRDQLPLIVVLGGAILLILLVSGAIAVGVVSMSTFSDEEITEEENNSTWIEPPSREDLPPGYYPEGVSSFQVMDVHTAQLDGVSYSYTYSQRQRNPEQSELVKLSISKNGSVTGTQTDYQNQRIKSMYNITSEDGQKYTVSKNGSVVREFGNSNYATGHSVIEQIFTAENFTLEQYESTEQGMLYKYSFEASDSKTHGNMVVNEEGLIIRAFIETMEGETEIKTEMRITDVGPE